MTYLSNKLQDTNNLGYFATEAALTTAYPVGAVGYFALVGTTDTFWVWDTVSEAWVNSGGVSGAMVLADAQTNTGVKTFLNTTLKLRNVANTFDGYFLNTNTADRIYTLPNSAGTIALTSDISKAAIDALAITTVGTINTGVWQGTAINQTYLVGQSGTNSGDNATNTQYSGLVSNATHTGEVTGATVLTIANNAVVSARIADNAVTNSKIAGAGTRDATTFYRGDGTFAVPGGGGDALTSNPLSQFASTTSAQLAGVISNETGSGSLVFGTSPNITTPTGIVKGDVGLGSVDNTTDAGKPVSTAQQTALNLKANLISPAFTTPNIGVATGSVSGNAGSATILQTARTIAGISFNGSANIAIAGTDLSDTALIARLASPTFTGIVTLPSGQALIAPALGTPASGVVTNLTGTASININGTVGATTPSTGAFTTLSASSAITASTTIELGHATDTTLSRSSSGTLAVEGIRVSTTTPLVVSAASYTTNTGSSLNMDNLDEFIITAQAGALLFNAPGGTLVQGRTLVVRIKDNGTARALTWNAVFRAMGPPLPSTTVLSKTLYLGFKHNTTDTRWDLIASAQEA